MVAIQQGERFAGPTHIRYRLALPSCHRTITCRLRAAATLLSLRDQFRLVFEVVWVNPRV
jgi:hypothetical protein